MPGPRTAELTQEATQALAAFIAGLNYQDLPERVREHTKNVLLDTLACAVAGHQGEETEQVACACLGARAIATRSSVIGGDRLSLAGATLLNGYLITAVTMCDIHRATLTHVTPEVMPPALAIAERDGIVRPRSACRAGGGLRDDDADRRRRRLSGDARKRLARARRARPVRRRGGGRPAARLRRRDHGEGLRARGQPGRRHVRGVGHADGEIPPMPRRAVRPDGGAAGRAELPRHARSSSPHKDGGLYNTYANGGKPETVAIGDLGQRWELEQIALRLWPSASSTQGMNTALFDVIEKHKIDPAKVKKLRVGLSKGVFDMHGSSPATRRSSTR